MDILKTAAELMMGEKIAGTQLHEDLLAKLSHVDASVQQAVAACAPIDYSSLATAILRSSSSGGDVLYRGFLSAERKATLEDSRMPPDVVVEYLTLLGEYPTHCDIYGNQWAGTAHREREGWSRMADRLMGDMIKAYIAGITPEVLAPFAKATRAETIEDAKRLGWDIDEIARCLNDGLDITRYPEGHTFATVKTLFDAGIDGPTAHVFASLTGGTDGNNTKYLLKNDISLDELRSYCSRSGELRFPLYDIVALKKAKIDGPTAAPYMEESYLTAKYIIALVKAEIGPEVFLAYPEHLRGTGGANDYKMGVITLHKAGITPQVAAQYPSGLDEKSLIELDRLKAPLADIEVLLRIHKGNYIPFIYGLGLERAEPNAVVAWGVEKVIAYGISVGQALEYNRRFTGLDIVGFHTAKISGELANSYPEKFSSKEIGGFVSTGRTPTAVSNLESALELNA